MNNARIIFLTAFLFYIKSSLRIGFGNFYATKTARYKEKLSVLVAIVNS